MGVLTAQIGYSPINQNSSSNLPRKHGLQAADLADARQGAGTYRGSTPAQERARRLAHRGARGHDVIDKKNVQAVDIADHLYDTRKVTGTFFFTQDTLVTSVKPGQGVEQRYVYQARQRTRDELHMVEATTCHRNGRCGDKGNHVGV